MRLTQHDLFIQVLYESTKFHKRTQLQLNTSEGKCVFIMSKTSVITTRVDPELKANAEHVLAALGMTTAQAITMFLKQVELNQGLP